MFLYNYYNINVTTLDDETQTYSVKDHMPFPSAEYIFNETGVDMRGSVGENESDSTIRYLTKLTMNTIKSMIMPEARLILELLIAKSSDYRKGFIDTVVAVISTVRHEGIAELLKTGKMTLHDLPKVVQIYAESNNLLINYYHDTLDKTEIRKDY